MRVLTLSDDQLLGRKIKNLLDSEGLDCRVAPLPVADKQIAQVEPELLVLGLSPSIERALMLLERLVAHVKTPIVCVGPAENPKLILGALRSGAYHYLDQNELESEFAQFFARFHMESAADEGHGRMIGVVASSGGAGASTVTVNVATAIASHSSVALLDLKTDGGDLAAVLDLKPNHSLADFARNRSRMDQVMFDQLLSKHAAGLALLPAPETLQDVEFVTPECVRDAIRMLRTHFDYVIVDLDHSLREEQQQAIKLCDKILVVFRLDFVSLRNVRRTLDRFERMGVPNDRVLLVANRCGQPKELRRKQVEEALGQRIAHLIPDDPKSMNLAVNQGVPVVSDRPASRVARSFVDMARTLNGKLT